MRGYRGNNARGLDVFKVTALAGVNREKPFIRSARASANPLALFAKAERPRRRRRRKALPTGHLRYGRLDPAIERSLDLERPPLPEIDAAEIERVCAKHADIRKGST